MPLTRQRSSPSGIRPCAKRIGIPPLPYSAAPYAFRKRYSNRLQRHHFATLKNRCRSSGNCNPQTGNARTSNGKPLPLKTSARVAEGKKVQIFFTGQIAAFRSFHAGFRCFSANSCRFGKRHIPPSAETCHMETVLIRGQFLGPKEGNLQPDLVSVARSDSRLVRKSPANATQN